MSNRKEIEISNDEQITGNFLSVSTSLSIRDSILELSGMQSALDE